jgi:hypothetical protein
MSLGSYETSLPATMIAFGPLSGSHSTLGDGSIIFVNQPLICQIAFLRHPLCNSFSKNVS